ncbi:MAG TPA: beta-ketoacyl synthase N-terminal-like domain-containing protein [Kofleriaceae bacterium]|jgi:3-oxoacyl-(acyl-carrier-protein) synthase/malonyl CoA-acyl carrier protein transacylase/phosphopantetheinyl transferase (holo-ACP synthase)|nr:beta-ketoacyl synthase N-terminal-like domain-containing protein [Kofleriaceae bacterium]
MADPVAIVGMGAVFPGASDLDAFWSNIERGVDAIRDVPASRLDPVYFETGTLPCTRGGFVDASFDPIAFGIMPLAAASAEPDQLLALHVAAAALDDAGCVVPRDRTAVILGRGGYLTPGMARLVNRVRTSQQLATTLRELLPDLDRDTIDKIRAAFRARSGEGDAGGDAIGLVPNLAASRIANRLDVRGPAYTIDAACASSLLAVDQACRELADHRADLVLAGGVHVCHDITFWSVFAQLGALSKTSQIRPFDRRADGIVIGEGAGIVVLKRLADAERDGDRIYATILGTGASSDGRESTAMRPRADGQLAAIRDAWRAANRDPNAIGLVEAHGTATPTGDAVELGALGQFFGATAGERAGLGSVKSMIGHAMPAAGAAGLIKTALAIHHGIVPPSLHCDEPNAALAATRFRVLGSAEPWQLPKLAGVSAFGFGGINAHVVIEGHASAKRTRRARTPELVALTGNSPAEIWTALESGVSKPGRMRFAMLEPTAERRALAKKVLDRGKAWRGNNDIWFAPEPLAHAGGKLAFVFPGVEAAFAANTDDVQRELGVNVPEIAAASAAASAAAPTARELEARGQGVFALGRLLAAAMRRFGITPAAIAGHSIGEWTGMVASELIPADAIDAFVHDLPIGSLEVPDVVFAAVGCSSSGAQAALDGLTEIAVSHDNCPHQSIVCGKRAAVDTAVERLAGRGVLCHVLPFKSGFHSPLLADYLGLHRRLLAELPLQRARIPLWSATTCAPYPDDDAEVRALAIRHLVEPVRFRELVAAMYASGIRAFVQLGVGSLASFVGDTLRGQEHLAISAASDKHAGLSQLARVRAALFADGFVDAVGEAKPETPRPKLALALGVPLVTLGASVPPLMLGNAKPDTSGDPLLAELLATLDEAANASRAVVDAYRARQQPALPSELVIRRRLGVAGDPYLLDHCFYRQPPDWPVVSDRYPVVPMTMTLGMMLDAARALRPELVPIALEDVRALRWMAVEPSIEIEIRAKMLSGDDADLVDVEIPGYARALVRLAATYPPPPSPRLAPLAKPRQAPHTAREMYDQRWMFHGPAYQGVVELGPVGDDGVDGAIDTLAAPGALLDCAGQLMGWWVMQHETRDRLAMPVHLERVELFGPHPSAGERLLCNVRTRELGAKDARADLELHRGHRVWARITSWTDRRFDSDDAVWRVLMYPETNALGVQGPGGVVAITEHWTGAASRELMMRRYLTERERAEYEALTPRVRRGWLLGRMAAKDAARFQHWNAGVGLIWPAEIEITNDASGKPLVDNLQLSIAHKDGIAVALVGTSPVGVDLEKIEPRVESFLAVAFTEAERVLGTGDEHWARLWAAKEAVAKLRGTGMTNPKAFEARASDGDRVKIDDVWVDTRRDGDYMIAWVTHEQ